MVSHSTHRQRGIALITVMLVVALVAIVATEMSGRLMLQMQRSANIQMNQQAFWYAMGAEAFAKRVIIQAQEENEKVTHREQNWAQGYQNFPVDFGEISGEIKDLHACLNLNALREEGNETPKNGNVKKAPAKAALEELIVNLNIEGVGQFEAEYMSDSLSDWLDSNDGIASAGGAEDNDYAAKEHPYLTANHYLANVNELRLVEHFSVPVINELKAHVCVIPQSNIHKININTLDAEHPQLLQSLLGIDAQKAADILAARDDKGFETIDEFFNLPEVTSVNFTDDQKQQFVVDSEYFKLVANTRFSDSYFSLNTTLKVVSNNEVAVLSRTIGRFNE
ncbi:type II secretion system minor pseudopilin GspK [Thalassotalea atypica]|uniref:type II secretion system minor pseudopilin GspK n=1 Tax=Thalassotalea atypica TaxID=2054316 RepID=UPI0025731C31|nr:type II secretion system minor pseudopilin GspK [Thalassotalea atypica]